MSSNLKRHFGIQHHSKLEKSAFMADICSCLELCSAYIQSLNGLCGAGLRLAEGLSRLANIVPGFRAAASQFHSAWEAVGCTTASASASVKTETLMVLQDLLNRLETLSSDTIPLLPEIVQVVGYCMLSYVELQNQFSSVSSCNFGKVAKDCSSGTHSMSKDKLGTGLVHSLKKNFGHVIPHKTPPSTPDNGIPMPLSFKANHSFCSPPSLEDSCWTPLSAPSSCPDFIIPTKTSSPGHSRLPESSGLIEEETGVELEDIINLLSCKPVGDAEGSVHNSPTSVSYINDKPPSWPSQAGTTHTWPRVGPTAQPPPFDIWSPQHLPSTWLKIKARHRWDDHPESSRNGDISSNKGLQESDVFSIGITPTGQDLVASVRQHRRHSSSDGIPDGPDLEPPSQISEIQAKTSTWPLKQPIPADETSNKFSLFGFSPN